MAALNGDVTLGAAVAIELSDASGDGVSKANLDTVNAMTTADVTFAEKGVKLTGYSASEIAALAGVDASKCVAVVKDSTITSDALANVYDKVAAVNTDDGTLDITLGTTEKSIKATLASDTIAVDYSSSDVAITDFKAAGSDTMRLMHSKYIITY